MDKDTMKGKIDDIKGRVKRQAGEWTGDERLQDEGAMDQAKGKVQNAWGKVKDTARDVKDDISGNKKDDRAA
jgi:uncharacterized protein YjbJ (UPF0337 family)